MTRARATRRARRERREDLRTVVFYLLAVIVGSGIAIGIDRWIHP